MNYKPHHTAISVRNLDASIAFYKQLGFKQVHRYDEEDGPMSIVPDGVWVEFVKDERYE